MNEFKGEILEILEKIKMKKVDGEIVEKDLIKESVTIRKSDVERLGKELMKEVDNFLHDEYIINNFPEMILDQQQFDRSVNKLKDKYESGMLNTEEIYHILLKIYLDSEIDGDLFFKKEAYLDIFRVLLSSHSYLNN